MRNVRPVFRGRGRRAPVPCSVGRTGGRPGPGDLLAEGLNHLTRLRDGGQDVIVFLADVLVSPDGLEGVT